nr:MAG TPA: hypothetical protein [Caudoviricetes sp.]
MCGGLVRLYSGSIRPRYPSGFHILPLRRLRAYWSQKFALAAWNPRKFVSFLRS